MPYTQEDIAASLSMNRVTVTRIMQEFRDKNWISCSYGIVHVIERKGLFSILPV